MAQPIQRTDAAIRSYVERLGHLMDQVRTDPLNRVKSVELVAHIVNNRSFAADQYRTLEEAAAGLPC